MSAEISRVRHGSNFSSRDLRDLALITLGMSAIVVVGWLAFFGAVALAQGCP